MKQVLFLIFSMVGIQGFGQDCGCMEGLRSGSWFEVNPLESPNDYEQDSIYLQLGEKHETYRNFSWAYLINRTDSALILENEYLESDNGGIVVESKDSSKIWNDVTYIDNNAISSNDSFLIIPKDHYALTLLHYSYPKKGDYYTQSRFKATFKNNAFYSEVFADSIAYCSFKRGYSGVSEKMSKEEIGKYAKDILAGGEQCLLKYKSQDFFEHIIFHQATVYHINGYNKAALKVINFLIQHENENNLRTSSFKTAVAYNIIIKDSSAIKNDTLRRYIATNYILNESKKSLDSNYKIQNNNFESKINQVRERIEKFEPYAPTKTQLEALNYQDYIEIIDGEEYFKIDCLGGELTKVRFKEE